jgi:hypothetical protein
MATTAALTVQDAHKLQATQLHLVHRRITAIPSSLSGVTSLTSLDLSDNPLKQLQPQNLPASLKQLVCAGCQLSGSLPLELTRLTCLEQLVAPANSISRADAILACQHLVHVGLAYNNITTLLGPNSSSSSTGPATSKAAKQRASSGSSSSKDWGALAASQIVCLDLSHNDIMDLHSILQQLQQLPKLRVLHLRGNPVSLLPHFKAAVLHTLPQLAYLDGQVWRCHHMQELIGPLSKATCNPHHAIGTATCNPQALIGPLSTAACLSIELLGRASCLWDSNTDIATQTLCCCVRSTRNVMNQQRHLRCQQQRLCRQQHQRQHHHQQQQLRPSQTQMQACRMVPACSRTRAALRSLMALCWSWSLTSCK